MVVSHEILLFHSLAGDQFGLHTAATHIGQPKIVVYAPARSAMTVYIDTHLPVGDRATERRDGGKQAFQLVIVALIVGIQNVTPLYKTERVQRIAVRNARVPTPRPQTGAESKRIYPSSSKILFMAAISKKRFTNKVLSNGFH